MKLPSTSPKDPGTVSYQTLLLIGASFGAGILADRLLLNILSAEKLSFSTLSLLGFFLTVFVSGASIILAVAAISLGRTSEHAVVQRADEGIKLQTHLFTQTTEALQRIESSTGVTEKRIEDIIQGRVKDASSLLYELGKSGKSAKEIEKEIQAELLEPEGSEEHKRRARVREERRETYARFQRKVLLTFSANPKLVAEKMGDGSFLGTGIDLFDGLYRHEGELIGVSALWGDSFERALLDDYVLRIARAIFEKKVDRAYLAIISEKDHTDTLNSRVRTSLSMFKGDIEQKIEIVSGVEETIAAKIEALQIGLS